MGDHATWIGPGGYMLSVPPTRLVPNRTVAPVLLGEAAVSENWLVATLDDAVVDLGIDADGNPYCGNPEDITPGEEAFLCLDELGLPAVASVDA